MSKNRKTTAKKLPIWVWIAGAVALIAVAAVVIFTQANTAATLPAEISVSQAAEKRDQGVMMVDVRQPEEWAAGHIPGATLIPLGEIQNRLSELPKDKEIVLVCRTGHRSGQARDILRSAGYNLSTSMAGGMVQWTAAGLPVVTGQ